MNEFTKGELLYANPLSSEKDVADFQCEGEPVFSFPQGCWRLENGLDSAEGQAANYVVWCPEMFPADLEVSWDFRPLREPGLAMFWFCASGTEGRDLFDPSLPKREGVYRQYFDGEVNAYHASYFRRKQPDERAFHTCNLRKSKGFHLVAQGGDPIPDADEVADWLQISVQRVAGTIRFRVNDLVCYEWTDDGNTYGPQLGGGRIGFRQMAPLIAEYRNLEVHTCHMETEN